MKYCKKCGESLNDYDKFCKNCGTAVEENIQNNENMQNAEQAETVETIVVEETPKYIECKLCGAKVDSSETNCPVCGSLLDKSKVVVNKTTTTNKKYKRSNGLAKAGFILSIIAFALGGWSGIVIGIVGLVLSIIGLTQILGGKGHNKVIAIIGIALGAYAIVMGTLYVLFIGEWLEQIVQELEETLDSMMEEMFVNIIKNIFKK